MESSEKFLQKCSTHLPEDSVENPLEVAWQDFLGILGECCTFVTFLEELVEGRIFEVISEGVPLEILADAFGGILVGISGRTKTSLEAFLGENF